MTSDQLKQQKQIQITQWIKLFGRLQNLWTASMRNYIYYFHSVLFLGEEL